MVLMMLRLTVSPERRDDVLKAIRATLSRTRAASGCVDCSFYTSADETKRILYVEEWASEDALARHLRTDCWKGLLAAMEASADQPDLRFIWSDKSCGLEYLEAQRLGAPPVRTESTMSPAAAGAAPETEMKIAKPS